MKAQPFQPGSRLVAYLRDSGGDDQDLSVEQQEQAVNAWSHESGYILTHIYTDAARPGSTAIGRDAFQAMLNHFRDPNCQEAGIVVWKFSRFARSIDDAQFYRADLRRRGYEVYSLHDNIPTGLDGRFFEAAVDWMNSRYLDDLAVDVKRGLYHLVKNYGAVPGRTPTGFKREPLNLGLRRDGSPHIAHRLSIDEELAPMIRRAFEMRATGASHKRIRKETGLPVSINLSKLFTNRIYVGELRYGELTIANYCEPMVDPELWDQVQARRKNKPNPRRVGGSFILSGLAYCSLCGSMLNGRVVRSSRQHTTWYYYICPHTRYQGDCQAPAIPRAVLEKAVVAELRDYILAPETLAELQEELHSRQVELAAEAQTGRKRANHELSALRKKLGHITDAIASTGYSRALVTKLSELEYREGELLAELERWERINASRVGLVMEPAEMSTRVIAALDQAEPGELREIIGNVISRLDVEREGRLIRGVISYHSPYTFENQFPGVDFRTHKMSYSYNRIKYSIARIEET